MPDRILLKHERDKLPLNRHSWVFSGAIGKIEGAPAAGGIVEVRAHDGRFIAFGQYHPDSKIMVRLLEWDQGVPVNEAWWCSRVERAVAMRRGTVDYALTNAYRRSVAVLQSSTPGMDAVKAIIVQALLDSDPSIKSVIEKSDGDGRQMEGLTPVSGHLAGDPVAAELIIHENGYKFSVDTAGQKTGFYVDQRENRAKIARYCAGADMLDLCSFSGAFSVQALAQGAATAILCDSSSAALTLARRNLALNGIDESRYVTACDNVFEYSRSLCKAGRTFDLVVLDPPKLMPARRDRDEAASAYKDLNLQAIKLVKKGGVLFTFSCSGGFHAADLRMAVAFAAKDAGRDVQILEQLHQGPDHPVRLSVPEAEYLKGLICRVW